MADIETDLSADRGLLHSMLTSAGTWALVLGVVGFVCGFVGPMVFSPDANQGPLLGLFITGPGGALLGAILGLIVGAARPPAAVGRKALVVVSVALAAVCLYFSMPQPQYHANVVDAEIVGCAAPDAIRDKAMDYWDDRVAKVTWAPPRAGGRRTSTGWSRHIRVSCSKCACCAKASCTRTASHGTAGPSLRVPGELATLPPGISRASQADRAEITQPDSTRYMSAGARTLSSGLPRSCQTSSTCKSCNRCLRGSEASFHSERLASARTSPQTPAR